MNDINRNSDIFFSIIIPNYNNAHFLKKNLISALEQTYENFEIILVDDVSTDNSVELAKEIFKNYPKRKTKIIEAKNKVWNGGGRNLGVSQAKGDYIVFIDSDDWFKENNFLEVLNKHIIDNNYPDLVRLSFEILTIENTTLDIRLKEKNLKELVDSCFVACWTKVIKKDKYQNFPENTLMEDVVQHIKVCDAIETFSCLSNIQAVVYNRQNTNSCSTHAELQNNKWISSLYRYYADLYDLKCSHDYCEDRRQKRLAEAKHNLETENYIQ